MYTLDTIMFAVSMATGIPIEQITGKSRIARYILPRHMFFYFSRQYTLASYEAIAEYCGGRDHATALYGARKYADKDFLTRIEKEIHNTVEDFLSKPKPFVHDEMNDLLGQAFYYAKSSFDLNVGIYNLKP